MITGERLCVNHLLIVTFVHFWIWRTCCFTTADSWGLMKFEWKREAALLSCTAAVPAQLVVNNWETIWLCLDRGFVEYESKPIWRSRGSGEFVPVNCNYSNDATGYSSFPFLQRLKHWLCSCAVLSPLYQPVSLIVHSLVLIEVSRRVEIHNPLQNYWPKHQKMSGGR